MSTLFYIALLLLYDSPLPGDNAQGVPKLPPASQQSIVFARDIEPILVRSCVPCHGPEKQRGGLRLDDGALARKGGNSGDVLKPGDSTNSRLLHLVAGLDPELRMPPKEKASLTREEIALLRAWIDQGASWPKKAATSASLRKSEHWAYRPIRVSPLPKTIDSNWARNGIDRFVLARLEAENLTPALEADRTTLIRRLSFDLLGLPPTPQEVEAFVNDRRSDAYDRLVERLLASPHYGERWGRHWLDLARYADSDGYEKDTGRPFAWRWRDWVIDAFNRDLPFDRFAIAQLAGDLLPNASLEDRTATGFHRNTLTNKEGGVDQEQFRVEALIDRVNTTTKVFLGSTLGCAQCHDHKYDPFAQREYYELLAFFDSDKEVDLPAPLPGEEKRFTRRKAAWEKERLILQKAVEDYQRSSAAPDPKDKKLAQLTKLVSDHDKKKPQLSYVPTLAQGPVRRTHVMIRGDFLRPGAEVDPGTPAVLPLLPATTRPTRLDLARWLVDPANPLTPRVTANWVWHHLFGRGLVATLEDFGSQGDRPSHPELLDWLAARFVKDGWSLKNLHRLIVTSATYRQSSRHRPELQARDPLNVLLARQNRLRLEAELLRDNVLSVSGLLTPRIGGPSVRPPQPPGIAELSYANSVKWVDSAGADRYRRGLYTWFQRTSPYPMLMTFDAPDGTLSCVRRERSNTPLQALTLLNDRVIMEAARVLAGRLMHDSPDSAQERLPLAFRLCVARDPNQVEFAMLTGAYDDFRSEYRRHPEQAAMLTSSSVLAAETAATTVLARMLLNLDEFVTRE